MFFSEFTQSTAPMSRPTSIESRSVELGFEMSPVPQSSEQSDIITLEAFQAGLSKKRARVALEDILEPPLDVRHAAAPEISSRKRARGTRTLKALREIAGREGLAIISQLTTSLIIICSPYPNLMLLDM